MKWLIQTPCGREEDLLDGVKKEGGGVGIRPYLGTASTV